MPPPLPPCSPNHPHHQPAFLLLPQGTCICKVCLSLCTQIPSAPSPPSTLQTLYLWKGASQMSCAGATAATVPRRSFRPPTKEGSFFSPFFFPFWRGGLSALLCASAPHPSTPALFWSSYSLCVLTRNRSGWKKGGIWYGSCASLRASHSTAGHYRLSPHTAPLYKHSLKPPPPQPLQASQIDRWSPES